MSKMHKRTEIIIISFSFSSKCDASFWLLAVLVEIDQ